MISRLQRFFQQHIQAPARDTEASTHRLHVAAAALLAEVMRVDDHRSTEEIETVLNALRQKFDLTTEEARELLQLASSELKEAVDYHPFTSLINQEYDADRKRQLVEYLWRVAYADGQLDKYEEHVVRKVAELLYVSHRDFVAAKLRVLQELGLE